VLGVQLLLSAAGHMLGVQLLLGAAGHHEYFGCLAAFGY
jgi:hypothetical protein